MFATFIFRYITCVVVDWVLYNTKTKKIAEMTVSVDMGSHKKRYQGDVKLTDGFGPKLPQTIAQKAVQWYKNELIKNNACQ